MNPLIYRFMQIIGEVESPEEAISAAMKVIKEDEELLENLVYDTALNLLGQAEDLKNLIEDYKNYVGEIPAPEELH